MSFTSELLNFINEVVDFVPGLESPYDHIRRLRRSRYYGALYRLESRKLITKKKTEKGIVYSITPAGRKLATSKSNIKKRTDGFSTIVTFDIPEQKRRQRKLFRNYLIRNGFRPLQKSVYISRNQMPGTIIELTKELGLNSYVSVVGGRIEYYL